MKRLLLLAAMATLAVVPDFRAEDDERWIDNDWPAARKLARRLDRPIFVVFRCPH